MAPSRATSESTSATATRMRVAPPAAGSDTVSWSRSRESSLSIEHQRQPAEVPRAVSHEAKRPKPRHFRQRGWREVGLKLVVDHRAAGDLAQHVAVGGAVGPAGLFCSQGTCSTSVY